VKASSSRYGRAWIGINRIAWIDIDSVRATGQANTATKIADEAIKLTDTPLAHGHSQNGNPLKNKSRKSGKLSSPKNVAIRTTLIPDFALNTSEKPRFATPFLRKTPAKTGLHQPKKITAKAFPLRVATWLHPVE
jgi:hypothetical protein